MNVGVASSVVIRTGRRRSTRRRDRVDGERRDAEAPVLPAASVARTSNTRVAVGQRRPACAARRTARRRPAAPTVPARQANVASGLVGGERERRRRVVRQAGRAGGERHRRRDRVDRERPRRGGAGVERGVGRPDLEGPRAVAQLRQRVRRAAARERRLAGEAALERRAGLARGERERRRRVVRRPGRAAVSETVGGVPSKPVERGREVGQRADVAAGAAPARVPVAIRRLRTWRGLGARRPVSAWKTLEYSAAAAATIGDGARRPVERRACSARSTPLVEERAVAGGRHALTPALEVHAAAVGRERERARSAGAPSRSRRRCRRRR